MADEKPSVAWCTACDGWVALTDDGSCPEESHGQANLVDERPDKEPLRADDGGQQKRCAKCGERYDAEFDACPRCTGKQQSQEALEGCGKGLSSLGCILTLFVTVPILLWFFSLRGCS